MSRVENYFEMINSFVENYTAKTNFAWFYPYLKLNFSNIQFKNATTFDTSLVRMTSITTYSASKHYIVLN